MKSKFALSFGIALIIVGIFNCFFDSTNVIMFGVSISAFIFSIISILFTIRADKKYELICIFPFVILLVFFCYSNSLMEITLVRKIVNSRITSVLTFVSFGLSFVSEYIYERDAKFRDKSKHISLISEILEYTVLLRQEQVNYREKLIENKIKLDVESIKFLETIEKLCEEKSKLANIKIGLLELDNDKFTLDEFDEIYIKENEILNYEAKIRKNRKNNTKK